MENAEGMMDDNIVPQTLSLEKDPEFAGDIRISSECMHTNDFNQNKAIGSDSEMVSISPGNTVTSTTPRGRPRQQGLDRRGGSTMSDLHNTEYTDESKVSKARISPGGKIGLSNTPNSKNVPRNLKSNGSSLADKSVSKTKSPAESVTDRSSAASYNRSDIEMSDETLARAFQNLIEPDPSAERDLDNASPETMTICERHPCHYCIFVYFPSSSVDDFLQPFRRKAFMDKLSQLQDPDLVKEVKESKCARDANDDRRIKSIERRSGTEIRLGELDLDFSFIKGLPRRRLTIAGPSFAHIGCALSLLEELLPFVVKSAVFPYRLPSGSSTRYHTSSKNSSMFNWEQRRMSGITTLRPNMDEKIKLRQSIATDERT